MIHTDFETFSEANLRQVGAYRYAEDPSTEVLIMCYSFDDGPVRTWVQGMPVPTELFERVAAGEVFKAHNAMFEYCIWNMVLQRHFKDIKIPKLRSTQLDCTAVRAAMCGLPRGLEGAGAALQLNIQKSKRGAQLIKLFCSPRKPTKIDKRTRVLPSDDRAQFNEFITYCKTDVSSERELDEALPQLPPFEKLRYQFDAEMNMHGLPMDINMAVKASVITAELAERAKLRVEKLTGGIRPTQRDRLLDWMDLNGKKLENLQAGTVTALLADKNIELDDVMREVLEIRVDAAKASVKKLAAMHRVAMRDKRVRGSLLVYGAHTGRWSGKLIQPQNFIRGLGKDDIAEFNLRFKLLTCGDADLFDTLYDKPLTAIAQVMRGFIMAEEGKRLLVVDYAQIEARVLAWLAGETEMLKAFFAGEDVYRLMAAFLYGKKKEDVTQEERRIAKNLVLGCGYGLGWKKFIEYCAKAGLIIDEEMSKRAVGAYRERNEATVRFWGDVERCAIAAVRTKKPVKLRNLTFEMQGIYLTILLPSQRRLYYPYPRVEVKEKWGRPALSLTFRTDFMGKWIRVDTYGGKLVENIVQAIACDMMVIGGINCTRAGYYMIGTVHDELIAEMLYGKGSLKEMETLACRMPQWANGCPVTAEGFESVRYRKG